MNLYKDLILLDKEKHKDLKLSLSGDLFFAKSLPAIPLLINEIALVGNTFPIVFTADKEPGLVALVSINNKNVAINAEGKWIAKYVPAYLKKYPFALATTEKDSLNRVVLIDEESPLFSDTGVPLFEENGESSKILVNIIDFLSSYEQTMQVTKETAAIISQSGILEDREISIGEGKEKRVLIKGFKVVNKEKLHDLSDEVLAEWVRKGIITLIDIHLKSLENIQLLFSLAKQ